MTGEPPRPLERAAREEPAPAPPVQKPSRTAAIVVLFVAAAAAVIVASFSTSNTAPRAAASVDNPSTDPASAPMTPLPGREGLVQPVVQPRPRDPSPFDGPTTDSAVAACVAEVRARLPDADSVEVQELFGNVDPTQGRADSLIVEGSAGTSVWHCASSKRQDGAVYSRNTAIETTWPGAPRAWVATHAVTTAAEESCMRQVYKLYPSYSFRGFRREQRGEKLYISGDAFPLNANDLVRDFSCIATISGGRIVDAEAKRSK